MKYLDKKIQKRIDDKLKLLNSFRPLPSSAVKKLREQFEVEMTYNSNAIEGNSLTLKETYLVINEGITIKGKPLKDHLEAKSHKEALEYLYSLVENGKNNTVSERFIRSLNQIVMQDIDKEWAGKYRNSGVVIGGADHKPPEALEIPRLMQNLIGWVGDNKKKMHPVELASIVHHKLVFIHPFFDGNGRTSRLTMNIVLMQSGFPLVIVLKNDRKRYYRSLSLADKGDYVPFVNFIARAVERTLDIYLKILMPSKKGKEEFISLSELAKDTKFTEKYLNLLARNGKLEAHKEGRNWLTSKDALRRYLESRERKRK
ncbi:MAG: cell filamentation protein Fic [Candidatus Moranbacteria bacterium RIFOXYA12_FULL_35_19]|nr:MAG: Filamentation induced by cAMP protein Fic [Candidatus Moranbacteria bacterium GW2011_GWF2_35_39]OGI30864.1 MAG: cell filamentation protein Fic [Candidatus Moranbacteria bacterium RIFOXYB12_FULL_35_8]OGI33094.1 MAG: cell filamentation protein Fic [Candidatus Moranbacteria bacterium RIFOXYC12_FULL_36_13]OGI35770.1 MAG: cell filamentation protein Fic [Candidatus Moranbacteria bacterium RIFOXYA12_FULL_35_19]